MGLIRVRLFAAAREAAGTPETTADALTIGALLDALERAHPDLARVLTHCSILVDGTRTTDRSVALAPGTTVDVLPPYAGG